MTFHIVTIFPEIFEPYFKEGVVGRAQKKGLIEIKVHNLRDYTQDKHRKVDDTPYGGGPGMVLQIEPIWRCIQSLKSKIKNQPRLSAGKKSKVVLFSAKGHRYDQTKANEYSKLDQLILICGRYEGVDERVAQHIADEEVSIGDYILTGGEIPALAVVDSVSRLVPDVLGNPQSLDSETYNHLIEKPGRELVDFPVYSKPEVFNGWSVPKILLGGNHGEIEKWRKTAQKNSGSVE